MLKWNVLDFLLSALLPRPNDWCRLEDVAIALLCTHCLFNLILKWWKRYKYTYPFSWTHLWRNFDSLFSICICVYRIILMNCFAIYVEWRSIDIFYFMHWWNVFVNVYYSKFTKGHSHINPIYWKNEKWKWVSQNGLLRILLGFQHSNVEWMKNLLSWKSNFRFF